MTKQQIQMGKTYRTRDGRKVEVGTTTDGGCFPVMAHVYDYTGQNPEFKYYTAYGQYTYSDTQKHWDLIEVKKVRIFANPDYKDPAPISMGKKYRTRDGRAVRVLAVDLGGPAEFTVVAATKEKDGKEYVGLHTKEGRYCTTRKDNIRDLIEITPFDDMKIDDPVTITTGSQGNVGKVFHFAGTTEDGRPKVWAQGRTSLTVKNKVCDWWAPMGCKPYVAE